MILRMSTPIESIYNNRAFNIIDWLHNYLLVVAMKVVFHGSFKAEKSCVFGKIILGLVSLAMPD